MSTAWSRELGTNQGRITPSEVSPPAGTFVFCLGFDEPGRFEALRPGDYAEVEQTATFAVGAKLFRVTAVVRPPTAAVPENTRWAFQLIIDEKLYAQHILASGSVLRTRQLAANISKLPAGAHTVKLRLQLLSNTQETDYMELHIVAGHQTTNTTTPGEVKGAREIDFATIPAGTKHCFLVATLASQVAGAVSNIELWNVTRGYMVTGATLSNTGAGDRTIPTTFVSAELTQGTGSGHLRTDASDEYEARLYRSGGVAGDYVIVQNAHLRIVFDA